jgi:hypothetical protein
MWSTDMSRLLRIEYPDAYYHVTNRGRGRQSIFHDEAYFTSFLQTLAEARKIGVKSLASQYPLN